jgi:2-polyprenyl-3-methyl-5-hydroxy-6-metoxy-1,4-benzoquinol methylase
MRPEHLPLLASQAGPLSLSDAKITGGRIESGTLSDGQRSWPIRNFIPRFADNPIDSFSYQWKKHPTILHTDSGLTAYAERFTKSTKGWAGLDGELMLEAGCGPGSFTASALGTGATLISFDLSDSVEINYERHGQHPNLLVVQASIYDMPVVQVDKAFCFGVLQHTPDPKASWFALVEKLKPGGKIACDIYAKVRFTRFHGMLRAKYLLRRWTAGLEPRELHKKVSAYVDLVWPFCRALQRNRYGVLVAQHFMIDNYPVRMKGMRPESYKEFAVVDIFDMLAPAYDLPVTLEEFLSWHQEAGLTEIDVHYGYNGIEGRGTKQKTLVGQTPAGQRTTPA